jgi:hypothetical protein
MPGTLPLVLMLLLALSPAAAEETGLAYIPLKHRLAEETADLVRPLLGEGEVVIPNRSQLIVKASPRKLEEIRALVDQLDTSPHRLLITVVQGAGLSLRSLNAQLKMDAHTESAAPDARTHSVGGHLYQLQSGETGTHVQRVQTLEGKAAYIQFGEERPIPSQSISAYGNRIIVTQGIVHREISTGFAVIPRLVGAKAVLELLPWSEQASRSGSGAIDTQSAATTVEADLGVWTAIGGQVDASASSETAPLSNFYALGAGERKIFLKIDDLDAKRP